MKAGARSLSRDVAGRVKSTMGGGNKRADVWETATTEVPGDEPPECQWCPICRAARRYRDGGGNSGKQANVWETATTEVPGDEPPECQWCPICRAARRYRDSGGTGAGLGSQLPRVGDTLAGFAQDAFSMFEAAMRAQQRPAAKPAEPDDASADRQDKGSDHGTVVGPGVAWPTVVHTEHEDSEAAHEGGHREEGGEPGDGPADSGGDEQVERPAE